MAYIGNIPVIGNFQVCDAISVVNGQAAYTMQVSSVNVVPETANHMIVSLNGVIQAPGSSYTVSGSTITFASNLATGDVINFIHILGSVLDLGVPSDDTVTAAKISSNAVTGAKLNTDVISAQTALAAEPADTDEFLVSDAGVLKRIDYSLIKGGGSHVLLSTTTVSSAASEVAVTSNIDSTYNRYMISIINLKPASNATHLQMRFYQGGSVDSGSVYDSTSAYNGSDDGSGPSINRVDGGTTMKLADEVGSDATEPFNGIIYLHDPSNTTTHTRMTGFGTWSRGNNATTALIGGRIDQAAAVDGFDFTMSSGNIDSCIIKLYGIT